MEYVTTIIVALLIGISISTLLKNSTVIKLINIIAFCLIFIGVAYFQFIDRISYTTEYIGTAGTVGDTVVMAQVNARYDDNDGLLRINRIVSIETGSVRESYVNAQLTYDRLPDSPEIEQLSERLFSIDATALKHLDESITGSDTYDRRPVEPLKKEFQENNINLSDNSIVIQYNEPYPVYRVVDFKNQRDFMIFGWWNPEPLHISTPKDKLNIYSVKNSDLIESEWHPQGFVFLRESLGRDYFYHPEVTIEYNQSLLQPLSIICISALPNREDKNCARDEIERHTYFHREEGEHFEEGSRLIIDTPKGMIKATYPPSTPVDLINKNLERREVNYDTENRQARIELVNEYYRNWLGTLFFDASLSSLIHWLFMAAAMIFSDEIKGRFIAPIIKVIFDFKRKKIEQNT